MSITSGLAHRLSDIVIDDPDDDPFFTVVRPVRPSTAQSATAQPARAEPAIDPEQSLVASLERATLAIVVTAAALFVAAMLGNGARSAFLAQDGSILCGALAILAAMVAIASTIQSLARLLRLFRSQSPEHVLAWRSAWADGEADAPPPWDLP